MKEFEYGGVRIPDGHLVRKCLYEFQGLTLPWYQIPFPDQMIIENTHPALFKFFYHAHSCASNEHGHVESSGYKRTSRKNNEMGLYCY